MLTEDQRKKIAASVQRFDAKVSEYVKGKSELEDYERKIQTKTEELLKVTEEERQMEIAMEVLYGQSKEESVAGKLNDEIKSLQEKTETLRNVLTKLKTSLLEQLRNLPIPADLESPKQENSNMAFPFFEDAKLRKEGIETICDLFREEPPIDLGDVIIYPERVVVRDAPSRQRAISKFVRAVQSFRMRVDSLSKSYEQIDEMAERLRRSSQYSGILKVLLRRGKLSSKQVAEILEIDERKAYDICYNLTRSNWSPNPIQKLHNGSWELTLAGEILVNRLLERHPDERLEFSSERTGQTELENQ